VQIFIPKAPSYREDRHGRPWVKAVNHWEGCSGACASIRSISAAFASFSGAHKGGLPAKDDSGEKAAARTTPGSTSNFNTRVDG
jgi:hypothetical protein